METLVNAQESQATPQEPLVDDKVQVKALLAEARNTKEMLQDFQTAIHNGTYQGHQMLAVAKGVAFLGAILNQNKAHIDALQEKLRQVSE